MGGRGRGRHCTNRMVVQAPGWRATLWLWTPSLLSVLASSVEDEVICAGRGAKSSEGAVCPESTTSVCPPGCEVLSSQDHCGSVCTAGPTVAVIASFLVVIVFIAGMVYGTRPQARRSGEGPSTLQEEKDVTSLRDSWTPQDVSSEILSSDVSSKKKGDEFTSTDAFENALAEENPNNDASFFEGETQQPS